MPQRGATQLTGDAVVTDVRTAKKFYKDSPLLKLTGTIPEVSIAAGSEAIPAGIHIAQNLSDIDADLAVGNIKKNVVMFGKTGTLVPIEDILGENLSSEETFISGTYYRYEFAVAGESNSAALATLVQAYAAISLAVGVAIIFGSGDAINDIKTQLVMAGVMVAESIYMTIIPRMYNASGSKALSGSQTCICRVHNYDVAARNVRFFTTAATGNPKAAAINVGSAKL